MSDSPPDWDRAVELPHQANSAQTRLLHHANGVGEACDNALAETVNGLYKTELIRRRGPWRSVDDVEYATLDWVDWFNNRRLLEPIGYVPPAEYEQAYYRNVGSSAMGVGLN
jgi:transposase InsO family protein